MLTYFEKTSRIVIIILLFFFNQSFGLKAQINAPNSISPNVDVGAEFLVLPQSPWCTSNSIPISLFVGNYSIDPVNFSVDPMTVTAVISGPVNDTLTTIYSNGILPVSGILTIFIDTFIPTVPGNYQIRGYLNFASPDLDSLNDTTIWEPFTVNQSSFTTINASGCAPLQVNNDFYIFTGTYTQSLVATNGCDSIITVNATVIEPVFTTTSLNSCGPITLGGTLFSTSGNYTFTLQSSQGCDSIVTVNLNIIPPLSSALNAQICQGQTYTFGSQVLDSSGIFTRTIPSVAGCDSVITLNLQVDLAFVNNITRGICPQGSFSFNQQSLTQAGNYSATFTALGGCDSLVNLNLINLSATSSNFADTICGNSTYTFGNQTLSSSGVYTRTIPNSAGCDSVITLNLLVKPTSTNTINATVCQGVEYNFGPQVLTQTGVYNRTLVNALGCDSVITLNLTVTPPLTNTLNVSICNGQTYQFGTQMLNQAGTYSITTQNFNGCDSIITLNLVVNNNSSSSLNDTICSNTTYTFGNQILTNSGNYTRTIPNALGCDSIINLFLWIKTSPVSTIQASICAGNSYSFGNQQLQTAGNYTRVVLAANGCDSTINLQLSVQDASILGSINGNTQAIRTQTYTYSIQQRPGVAYNWTTSGTLVSGQGTPQIQVTWPQAGGQFVKLKQTINGNCPDSLEILVNVQFGVGIEDLKATSKIKVYPNPFQSNLVLSVEGENKIERIQLIDLHGKLLMEINQPITATGTIEIQTPNLATGAYFLRVIYSSGIQTLKVVKTE